MTTDDTIREYLSRFEKNINEDEERLAAAQKAFEEAESDIERYEAKVVLMSKYRVEKAKIKLEKCRTDTELFCSGKYEHIDDISQLKSIDATLGEISLVCFRQMFHYKREYDRNKIRHYVGMAQLSNIAASAKRHKENESSAKRIIDQNIGKVAGYAEMASMFLDKSATEKEHHRNLRRAQKLVQDRIAFLLEQNQSNKQ